MGERRRNLGRLLMRSFWALMLIGHVPALIAVHNALSYGESALARYVLLLCSQLFFVLKLIDVPWLRCAGGCRTRAACLLLVLALHSGVFERLFVNADGLPPTFQLLTVGGGLGALGGLLGRAPASYGSERARREYRRRRDAVRLAIATTADVWPAPRLLLLAQARAQRHDTPH